MRVEAIHLGAAFQPENWAVDSVRAVAGKGLEGDRYFFADGAKPGQALTLVEQDVVEEVGLPPGGTRRQLTVSGTGTKGGSLHVEGTWEASGPVDNFKVSGTLGGGSVMVLVPEA